MPESLRRRSTWELEQSGEDALFAYLAAARRTGDDAAIADIHRVLVVRYIGFVRAQVLLRVADMGEDVVDLIVQNVLVDMLKAGFRGGSAGEYVNRIKAIVNGKVNDHFRKLYPQREHEAEPLATDDGDWDTRELTDTAGEERRQGAEARLDARRIVREELQALRDQNPLHADAVERVWLDDGDPQEVADELGLTRDNVDQIKSRFKKQVRERLQREGHRG